MEKAPVAQPLSHCGRPWFYPFESFVGNSLISGNLFESGETILFCAGYVALIVGGNNESTPGIGFINSVELFSPEGGCQYHLADLPIQGDYLYWHYWPGNRLECDYFIC